MLGRSVEDRVHSPQQNGPGLVVETDHNTGLRQVGEEPVLLLAPFGGTEFEFWIFVDINTNFCYNCKRMYGRSANIYTDTLLVF